MNHRQYGTVSMVGAALGLLAQGVITLVALWGAVALLTGNARGSAYRPWGSALTGRLGLLTALLVTGALSGCTPNVPPEMQAAISEAVVAQVIGDGAMFYSAGVDSFEVKDARIDSNTAWVHAWLGVWFKNRVSGPGFTAHTVNDEEFTLGLRAGHWMVTSIQNRGYAPGAGP